MNPKIRLAVIVIAVIVGIISAKNKKDRRETASQRAEREHNVINPGEDPRFKAAEAEARRRWPEFTTAFKNRQPGDNFAVKAHFSEGKSEEWMWVGVTSVAGSSISGTLDNEPVYVHNVKEGQRVAVSFDNVDDWIYRSGGKTVGGFTSKVLQQIETERK